LHITEELSIFKCNQLVMIKGIDLKLYLFGVLIKPTFLETVINYRLFVNKYTLLKPLTGLIL
jgi:hypothetical protein